MPPSDLHRFTLVSCNTRNPASEKPDGLKIVNDQIVECQVTPF